MSIVRMQPNPITHFGYFQLVNKANAFVFANGVSFIKWGTCRFEMLLQDKANDDTLYCANNENKMIDQEQVSYTLKNQ